jgi:CRISPR-associated protein Cmr2
MSMDFTFSLFAIAPWSITNFTGILGSPQQSIPNYDESPESREVLNANPKVKEAFNDWVINLAKVGFYLTDEQ